MSAVLVHEACGAGAARPAASQDGGRSELDDAAPVQRMGRRERDGAGLVTRREPSERRALAPGAAASLNRLAAQLTARQDTAARRMSACRRRLDLLADGPRP